jgi:predicted transcriptional regulator
LRHIRHENATRISELTKQIAKHRSRHEIIGAILAATKEAESLGGIKITRLRFLARLPSKRLNDYLDELLEDGLISRYLVTGRAVAASPAANRRESRRDDSIHITQIGLEFLRKYAEIRKII